MFVAAIAVVTYCVPRAGQGELVYETGRPWGAAALMAPFDIPVHMDAEKAKSLRDSVDAAFEPVMQRDLETEKIKVAEASAALGKVKFISYHEKNAIIKALNEIYSNGIVPRETYDLISKGELPNVKFINGNEAMSMPSSLFLSPRAAYAKLDADFPSITAHTAIAEAGIASLLVPNITPDSLTSQRLLEDAYQRATAPTGVIQQGERIIDKGDIVTPRLAVILDTYQEMVKEKNFGGHSSENYPVAGQLVYVILIFFCLYGYLAIFRKDYFQSLPSVAFLLCVITVFALVAYGMHSFMRLGIYLVPFAMVPLLVHIFMDSRTAVFVNYLTVFLAAMVVALPLEFLFIQFLAGVVAVTSLHQLTRRSQLIRTAVFVFLIYCVGFAAVDIMQAGSLSPGLPKMIGCFGINAIFICFSYILMFVIERAFGFTSRVTLVELSDINNPLLRELSEECPGTFQHSMGVSNLASAAAAKIGANTQLVRTGALYHDIGKLKNPAFFTENQHGVNPHDSLDPIQSARVVTGHVREGLAMAEKAKLPQVIRDFITQHHGRGVARYFYNTYCNNHPDEQVDTAPFSYPGPNPQTPEASIVMMADAVEAASRSLKEHTPEAIRALVDKIVDSQISAGLHNDSALSFRDVKQIKNVFVQRLLTMYHSRISYPELNKKPNP